MDAGDATAVVPGGCLAGGRAVCEVSTITTNRDCVGADEWEPR